MQAPAIIPYTLVRSLAAIGNIYEMRLLAWIIAKAQSVVKHYDRQLGDINVEHAMGVTRLTIPGRYLLPEGDRNYKAIAKACGLAAKTIEIHQDAHLLHLNIIANPEVRKVNGHTYVTCIIHSHLWRAMMQFGSGYRLVDIATLTSLTSVYSCISYILVSQQAHAMTYSIDTIRQLYGIDGLPAYKRTSNIIARIIDPSRAELDAKASTSYDYSLVRSGRGGGYKQLQLIPRPNTPTTIVTDTDRVSSMQQQRVRLDDRVADYLATAYEMTAREQEQVEGMLIRVGTPMEQVAWLATVRETAIRHRVANRKGYLVAALRKRK